ncbi:MAG: SusC/RagA family TonB-linked outer membrane protein, partial [bacterium]
MKQKRKRNLFLVMNLTLIFLLACSLQMLANDQVLEIEQQRTISGKVTDVDNEPLPGVNIVEKGTTNGTVTDANGNYSLTLTTQEPVLTYSFIGFLAQEIEVGNQTIINVTLLEDIETLEEVVVVGYGQQTKLTVTGSVSSIKSEELEQISAPTIGEGILGRISGVQMTQDAGTPGQSDPTVFIRGIGTFNNAEPLFIIDGVPSGKRAFMQLNPTSILDMSILKDASATAVYGVRGANGVIIVSTKKGKTGPANITAQVTQGIQTATKLLNYADSYRWALAYNEMLRNDGETEGFISEDYLRHYQKMDEPLLFPSIDWVNEVLNNNAPQTRASMDISGGSENIRYFT